MKEYSDKSELAYSVVLFDGVCNLCDKAVSFIIPRDRGKHFRFAPLQSEAGQQLLRQLGRSFDLPDSMILIEGKSIHTRSTAALRIAKHLRFPWPLLYMLIAIPKPMRDAVYKGIAANRYRWFGRKEQCLIPSPEVRERFLE